MHAFINESEMWIRTIVYMRFRSRLSIVVVIEKVRYK